MTEREAFNGRRIAKPAYDLAREAARRTDEKRAQLGSEIGIRPDPLSYSRSFIEK